MPVEQWFAVPIYFDNVKDPVFTEIQKELTTAFDHINSKDGFADPWNEDKMSVSTGSFAQNVIEEYDLTAFKAELYKHVQRYLESVGKPMPDLKYEIRDSWMTYLQKGSYAHKHNHGWFDVSGVYYFKSETDDSQIYFHTPAVEMTTSFLTNEYGVEVRFKPEVGKLILFPSFLPHGVTTKKTDSERVSLSFNIIIEK
jgi:uncharacterized protein (TIGR02466 family)